MGTATRTRSQSRKTRSTFSSEASDKVLSSPLGNLSGNHLDSTSRRSTGRPANASIFSEKENVQPQLNGQSDQKLEFQMSLEQKAAKKRKQSVCKTVDTGTKFLKVPVFDEQASQDLQSSKDVSRFETCSDRPSVQQTCAEPESGLPNESNVAGKGKVDDATEAPIMQTETGNDRNTGVVPSSTNALAAIQKDYERLFAKYKKLKERRLDEVEDLYKEQNSRISEFVQATQALIDFYKEENELLRIQIQGANIPELLNRCKDLEKANLECRDHLLQEQSISLELRQDNKRLKSVLLEHIADKNKQSELVPVPVQCSQTCAPTDLNKESGPPASCKNSMLVQRFLECVLGLRLSCGEGADVSLHFEHCPTGFSFNLKEAQDAEIADLVGGGEFMYQNVSLGACKRAVDWMKEKEVIFGMDQAQLLLKKLIGFLNRGFYG